MSSTAVAPRARKTFSRLKHVLDLPNLIDIQKASFEWFLNEGLRETIDDISPIEDYTGTLAVEFADYEFGEPAHSINECREKDLTYQAPLSMTVRFVNTETGEIREQRVFMGDFPMMTEWGTFIINGTERVIVTQLVRSPGAYLMEPKDATKQVFTANLMPSRGSWLELEIDKKGVAYARIDRKRKLPITTLLRALPAEDPTTGFRLDTSSNEKILELFDGSVYIRNTLEKDPSTREEEALIEVFKKQRPGEPPTLDNARNLLRALFFDPKRYDLTKVGRYKLNQRLGVGVPEDTRVLTTEDILALVRKLVSMPANLGVPEDSKDFAADAISLSRDPIRAELDEYEHFGNRRLRTTGELIQEAFRVGLYRMERVVRERMTTEDVDTITPQTIINIRPVVAALKEFFGSSQLSQFMDQTNTLAGLTHRRRLSALGAGGLTRERAPIEVRDVHPTHYGRMCPIETPEGPNIGLIGSLASMATVSEFGFIQTPYRVVKGGKVTDEIVYLDASEEAQFTIAQASEQVDEKTGKFANEQVLCRSREGEAVMVAPKDVQYMDVSASQIVSVATALIPFLEHNDANRALMGANMQRQAVPLMIPQAPLVGTGVEYRAAVDTGDVVLSRGDGTVIDVDAEHIVVEGAGTREEYALTKFMRSNQGTLIHQKPVVRLGEKVRKGTVLADGSSTDGGELALGANLLVAFMPWEGYNFEDAIVLSERLVKDDVLSSIHIHEYEIDARSTKLGDEEITRDIPNRSEESLANLDERGVVRIGAEVGSGDLLVGKVTPKGETELTAEEKLIRAIFKEKAREVRDTSLKVPHGEGGKVIGVKTFSRDNGDDLPPGVNELVRVFVAKKRKISEGDKLAGRHGNKGVISKIVPEEDMPFLEDGRPVDVVLNPLGVPSRMNIGQILETHLGWAAAHGVFVDSDERTGVNPRAPINAPKPHPVATPVFDGATEADVDDALVRWAETTDLPIKMNVDRSRPAGRKASGKVRLYNGKTGEPFEQKVTVGYMYILKLLHLVDDKIHARSTGPYSLVTQQPLGGKAQFGGQRFGEMEVWALEAYGAAYTLQEMLTIKSDDTIGRVKAYEAIVKGENIAEPSIPESFKVLLKEMQSLALDVHVQSDDGREVEVREEDDELLRAAEELGIDLSPAAVRAAGELSAQEVEEGAAAADEGGDEVVAADETLDGVEAPDIAELEVGLADAELDD
ncbi:rpoB: DNA-directed RNA polymerase subunit beta [Gaiella occulta]|uniref:DNA-directed RNA polymerase subunit beta n=1 Tax=Gaiella occulta TaxID=1002870 RepID=A0A7M2YWX9_9ACTN|nr:DNA-directed RNA polymerase subunit beta [Gaiella occulta]RDI74632.1 rpoB: DNA-directed RNA polymerase subunit beta [Gaiella occulta]